MNVMIEGDEYMKLSLKTTELLKNERTSSSNNAQLDRLKRKEKILTELNKKKEE
jgi:hypothetical protein